MCVCVFPLPLIYYFKTWPSEAFLHVFLFQEDNADVMNVITRKNYKQKLFLENNHTLHFNFYLAIKYCKDKRNYRYGFVNSFL